MACLTGSQNLRRRKGLGIIRERSSDELDLTIFHAEGDLSFVMLFEQMQSYYARDAVQRHLIWDFTEANVAHFTQAEMERILGLAETNASRRRRGRTVLVGPQDLTYGMARMYEILAEICEHPLEHHVTRDMDSALAWITQPPARKESQA